MTRHVGGAELVAKSNSYAVSCKSFDGYNSELWRDFSDIWFQDLFIDVYLKDLRCTNTPRPKLKEGARSKVILGLGQRGQNA